MNPDSLMMHIHVEFGPSRLRILRVGRTNDDSWLCTVNSHPHPHSWKEIPRNISTFYVFL